MRKKHSPILFPGFNSRLVRLAGWYLQLQCRVDHVSIPDWSDWQKHRWPDRLFLMWGFNSRLVRLAAAPATGLFPHNPFQFQIGPIGSALSTSPATKLASFNSRLVRLAAESGQPTWTGTGVSIPDWSDWQSFDCRKHTNFVRSFNSRLVRLAEFSGWRSRKERKSFNSRLVRLAV